jgi:hypothetical protein
MTCKLYKGAIACNFVGNFCPTEAMQRDASSEGPALGYGAAAVVIGCAQAGTIASVRRGVDPAVADRL